MTASTDTLLDTAATNAGGKGRKGIILVHGMGPPAKNSFLIIGMFASSLGITVALFPIYELARTILWEGLARELRLFSPHLGE